MKSNAPLHRLREIVRLQDEAMRVYALEEWIDRCTANIASSATSSHQERLISGAETHHARVYAAKRQIAKLVSDISCEVDIDVLGSDAKPDGNLTTLVTLTVIVPEGVEHPRKRQARERAEAAQAEGMAS